MGMSFQSLLTMFGIGSMVAGTMTSSAASYREAQAVQRKKEYDETVDRNNAQLAEWEARDALERGADAEQRHRLKVAGLKGTQRARIASSGIVLGEGSPLRVLSDTDILGELDAKVIRANAEREAFTKRNEAIQHNNDAEFRRAEAESISPLKAGASTLLNGVSGVASKWYGYSKQVSV